MKALRTCLAVTGFVIASSIASAADLPNREAIYRIQKAYWQSIDTLEATGEEFPIDKSLQRLKGSGYGFHVMHFIYGAHARMLFQRISKKR